MLQRFQAIEYLILRSNVNPNILKQQLHNGDIAFGAFIQIGHPAVAEIFCRAGLGWIILDCEHGGMDLETVTRMIRAMETASAGACQALIRLPSHDPACIARGLVAGARGIVVPMVNAPDQAKRAVAAAKYPSLGR